MFVLTDYLLKRFVAEHCVDGHNHRHQQTNKALNYLKCRICLILKIAYCIAVRYEFLVNVILNSFGREF